MLGHIDGFAVPDPGQHFTGVMAQVPQAHAVCLRGAHGIIVIQICGYIVGRVSAIETAESRRLSPGDTGLTSTAVEVLRCQE